MRLYGFDYERACCSKNDFDFKVLGKNGKFAKTFG